MITHESLLKAFHAYDDAPEPKPTVSAVAREHGVPYDMLRGALLLHDICPQPLKIGRGPSRKPKAVPGPRGRPKRPPLEGQEKLLSELRAIYGTVPELAKVMRVPVKTLRRWIAGGRMDEKVFSGWERREAPHGAETSQT